MNTLKVSIVQTDLVWQNPAANCRKIGRQLNSLDQTDLIVLPEFFSTGFYKNPEEHYETMEGDTVVWMLETAKERDAVVTGSVVMQVAAADGPIFLNRMLWACPDGSLDWYDKRHLFRYGGEHHHYTAGAVRKIVKLHEWSIALFVCYDVRFPVWCRNQADYDVALYVANWPYARQYAWDTLIRARAIENQCYVLGVNRVGQNPAGEDYRGGSAILDPLGMPLALCGYCDETIQTVELSKASLQEIRKHFPAALDQDRFMIADQQQWT